MASSAPGNATVVELANGDFEKSGQHMPRQLLGVRCEKQLVAWPERSQPVCPHGVMGAARMCRRLSGFDSIVVAVELAGAARVKGDGLYRRVFGQSETRQDVENFVLP